MTWQEKVRNEIQSALATLEASDEDSVKVDLTGMIPTRFVSKTMQQCVQELEAKRYYASAYTGIDWCYLYIAVIEDTPDFKLFED